MFYTILSGAVNYSHKPIFTGNCVSFWLSAIIQFLSDAFGVNSFMSMNHIVKLHLSCLLHSVKHYFKDFHFISFIRFRYFTFIYAITMPNIYINANSFKCLKLFNNFISPIPMLLINSTKMSRLFNQFQFPQSFQSVIIRQNCRVIRQKCRGPKPLQEPCHTCLSIVFHSFIFSGKLNHLPFQIWYRLCMAGFNLY